MRSPHVSKNLSAYCHGELPEEESRRVAEHLIGCQRCRREFEEIKLGVRLAEQLPRASAPASIWREIEAVLDDPATRSTPLRPEAARRAPAFRWQRLAAACAVLLLALVAGIIWYSARRTESAPQVVEKNQTQEVPAPATSVVDANPQTAQNPTANNNTPQQEPSGRNGNAPETVRGSSASGPSWEVARVDGAPKVGANPLQGSGRLGVGEWLETDSTSRAKINVADIGQVDIGPNSRVRLVGTRSTEHRLALERGRLHAMIDAPPRLFVVETPSATAIDLGCSYTLEVDDAGRSVLHVTSGWVALDSKGRESIVPAGAICVTEKGKGPGTPYFDDASVKFRDALMRLDFRSGGTQALNVVLAEAREYDTLTLWHLLARVRLTERGRVYDRLASLIPPPTGVTREGILRLDKWMLDRWKKDLEWAWFE